MAIRTSKFYPRRSGLPLSVGATPTALIGWLFLMLLLNLYLESQGGTRHPTQVLDHPQVFFQGIETWHRVDEGQWLSLQQALMLTQVLWLVWLWTKFAQARRPGTRGRTRISWQVYLVYGGLALLLICQQQVFYRLFTNLPETRLIPFPGYLEDDAQLRFEVPGQDPAPKPT